jgi:hypothetical protein
VVAQLFSSVTSAQTMLRVSQHVVQKNLDLLAQVRNATMASILL